MFALACRTHLSVDSNSVGHVLHHTHVLVVRDSHPVDVRLALCQPHDYVDFHCREICVFQQRQLHHFRYEIDADVHWVELAHFLLLQHHFVRVDDAKFRTVFDTEFNQICFPNENKNFLLLTMRRNVFIGRRNVSLIRRAGGFFGFELGVCTAQHLINIPMTMMKAMPMQITAYQFSVTHCATVCNVCLFNRRFFRRTSGPSASTARHFKKTSQ